MPAVDAYCVYAFGVDCATAGVSECDVLTNVTFASGLCSTLAGSLTESETCDEWAASFDDDFLNEQAAGQLGATCPDLAAGLAAGYAAGDAGTLAQLDALAAGVVGMGCGDYGAAVEASCIAEVA